MKTENEKIRSESKMIDESEPIAYGRCRHCGNPLEGVGASHLKLEGRRLTIRCPGCRKVIAYVPITEV